MMTSNKPYFIRAIYDWIVDNELTPYLLVNANDAAVDVPQAYANEGKIVLNISPNACRQLKLENDLISFVARFGGKTVDISAPPSAVFAIYAKENGRGMEFGPEYDEPSLPATPSTRRTTHSKNTSKPVLTLVKNDKDQGDF